MIDPTSPSEDSKMAGKLGEYPGTYGSKKTFSYNGLEIGFVSNHPAAYAADHNRNLDEAVSPIASRGLKGPLAQPTGDARAKSSASGETGSY